MTIDGGRREPLRFPNPPRPLPCLKFLSLSPVLCYNPHRLTSCAACWCCLRRDLNLSTACMAEAFTSSTFASEDLICALSCSTSTACFSTTWKANERRRTSQSCCLEKENEEAGQRPQDQSWKMQRPRSQTWKDTQKQKVNNGKANLILPAGVLYQRPQSQQRPVCACSQKPANPLLPPLQHQLHA